MVEIRQRPLRSCACDSGPAQCPLHLRFSGERGFAEEESEGGGGRGETRKVSPMLMSFSWMTQFSSESVDYCQNLETLTWHLETKASTIKLHMERAMSKPSASLSPQLVQN